MMRLRNTVYKKQCVAEPHHIDVALPPGKNLDAAQAQALAPIIYIQYSTPTVLKHTKVNTIRMRQYFHLTICDLNCLKK
jgi:hypothetical protein